MIEVKNLVKDYGKHHAVKDISFSVPDGQIVGLLGPNGAGKSTTMNIMTGYISATSGEVKIGGYDILEQPIQAKKLIGYLPEIPPLYEDMTVAEYLNFICDLKGIRKKTEKESSINEVTEAVKISDMKGRLIKNLSKGYKQRVGLAQALIGNPNQIIEIRALIKSLGQKHTIILSSHILSEVNAICDYVLIIDKGTLVAEDTPEHLSEDFSDTDNINMSVKGSREQVEEVLKVSEYIRDYKIIDEKDGIVDVQAKTATKEDIRDNLFFEFAEEKLPIIKMERESLSLEDVFLKLTGQDVRNRDIMDFLLKGRKKQTARELNRQKQQRRISRMKAIYLKEMRSYFHSLAAYIYFALFIAATGVYFSVICMSYGYTDYAQYVFSNSTILYIVIVPILTMRLFAEEKKQRTDQLLYTSPIRSGSIVFGKYLASVTLLAISMLVSIIEAGVLSMFGNVNWKTVLTGCLGYFLLGACLMAVGMFVSSLTDNQMIAAALSFAVVLFCMLLPNISNVVPGRARYTYIVCVLAVILIAWFFYDETKNVKITAGVGVAGIAIIAILSKVKPALFDNGLSKIIDWFSVLDRFNDFCSGILNASSIIYYVSFIAVFLFLTMQGIEKRRWN